MTEAPINIPAVVQPSKTPTQAKADSVSALLATSVARASELRLTPEETKELKEEFGDEAFRPGAAGKESLIYIEHAHLRDRLDKVLGMGQAVLVPLRLWQEEAKWTDSYGAEKTCVIVYVEAAFIVRGHYITQAVGDMAYYQNNPGQNYGDAVEGAETAALRRCAKKFGVGLQAWSKTWCEGWWMRKGTQTPQASGYDPAADFDPADAPHLPAPNFKGKRPPCPKCGKAESVIVGRPEYGGGFVCFKKKKGCGHKWDGKDVRTGEDAAPTSEYPPILAKVQASLDPDTVNLEILNGRILAAHKAIPGKHPERQKAWKLISDFAASYGFYYNHGNRRFQEGPVDADQAEAKESLADEAKRLQKEVDDMF